MRPKKSMAPHSKPKIQNCPTCGRMRVHHRGGYFACDTPAEVVAALKEFKAANGLRWKSKLVALWQGPHCSERLQLARNIIGPRRLYNLEL